MFSKMFLKCFLELLILALFLKPHDPENVLIGTRLSYLKGDEPLALLAVPYISRSVHVSTHHLLLGRVVVLPGRVGPVGRNWLVVKVVHRTGEEVVVSVYHGLCLNI